MCTMRVGAEDGKLLVSVDLAGLVGGAYGATQLARRGHDVPPPSVAGGRRIANLNGSVALGSGLNRASHTHSPRR